MTIFEIKNSNPVNGVLFEKGVLKILTDDNLYLTGVHLERLYAALDEYFKRVDNLEGLLNQVNIDYSKLQDGYNYVDKEVETKHGTLKITLKVYYKFRGTPFTDSDSSFECYLEEVTELDFYDLGGMKQTIDLNKDEAYLYLIPNINIECN